MTVSKLRKTRNGRPAAGTGRRPALTLCEKLEGRLVLSAFTVTNLDDGGPGSLRAAIDAANAAPGADVIEFAGGLKGTIGLASQLDVRDDLTIVGRGEEKIVLSGGGSTRVLSVGGADTELAVRHLTMADGLATSAAGTALGGGLLNQGASVSLEHVTFEGNRAVGQSAGGGAVANVGGVFHADHIDFVGNGVESGAGRDCWGGAVFNDQRARVDIDHATFAGNTATGGANGGAVCIADGSQVTLDHCVLDANQARGAADLYAAGGAIMVQSTGLAGASGPVVNITHCTFTGNRASVSGGVAGSDARGQGFGGAIMVELGPTPPNPTPPPPTVVIEHSAFDGNAALGRSGGSGAAGAAGRLGGPAWGGAVFNAGAVLTLRYSRFTDNQARGGDGGDGGGGAAGGAGNFAIGGAVAAGALAPLNASPATGIDHCEFAGNRAIGGSGGAGGANGNGGAAGRADGGGVGNLNGPITIDDSSLSGNTAIGGDGGAAGAGASTKGGEGGLARGGGFANERGALSSIRRTSSASNQAIGGAGGLGRPGGDALGGGVYNGRPAGLPPNPNAPADLTLIDCAVVDNLAAGGTGGAGASGGNALGGGIANFNPAPPLPGAPLLTLLGTLVTGNSAVGGAGGVGGAGVGGGLYNQTTAFADVDAFTSIVGNHASTGDDEIFGPVTPV
jgi:hypothetical protein